MTAPLSSEQLNANSIKLWAAGKKTAAIDSLLQAINLSPEWAALYYNLGFMSAQKGDLETAEKALYQGIDLTPNDPQMWLLLGKIEMSLANFSKATECFTRTGVMLPHQVEPLLELARCSTQQGLFETAILQYRHIILLNPKHGVALTELGSIYDRLRMNEAAKTVLQQAVTVTPNYAPALLALAVTFYHLRQYQNALSYLKRCEQAAPDSATVHNNLGMVYNALVNNQRAAEHFRHALRLNPHYASVHSNLLLHLHYQAGVNPQEILAEALRFEQQHIPKNLALPANYLKHKKLRIGYVSSDFRHHAVGLFIEPILAHHNKKQFEIYLYADVHTEDSRTRRLQGYASHWRPIINLSDAQVIQQIRQDEIDILVDLAGHTADNRLTLFAQKPAPVQITWLGYPGTTGLKTIDYLITDEIADPTSNSETYLVEQPLRLKHGIFCYRPELEWAKDEPISPLPALKNGYVTFASFNNLSKVNTLCLVMWQQILTALPTSQLLIKGRIFDDPELAAEWQQQMAALSIDITRVKLLPYDKLDGHIQSYQQVDIHLDSYPYGGGTTTCDALWMGVPVITLSGNYRSSRITSSLLHKIGADDWVAKTKEEYVSKAVALATELTELATTRQQLRQRLKASAIYDAQGFTKELEQAYCQVSQRCCISGA